MHCASSKTSMRKAHCPIVTVLNTGNPVRRLSKHPTVGTPSSMRHNIQEASNKAVLSFLSRRKTSGEVISNAVAWSDMYDLGTVLLKVK